MSRKWELFSVCICLTAMWWFTSTRQQITCIKDASKNDAVVCRPVCSSGEFGLTGMTECHPLLSCDEISSNAIQKHEVIGGGAVKRVIRASWNGFNVTMNSLSNPSYLGDFHHGLDMLQKFQTSPYVTQLVGICKNTFITEYHPLGTAADLVNIIRDEIQYDTVHTRFQLCISYIEVIEFLHQSPLGTRVMCDSNDITKTLEQFLLTSDLRLVVNDLDALPEVDKSKHGGIKCGHRELYGDFVAPEQLWPFEDRPFKDGDMPLYDEKTDIWKIPSVCEHFLGDVNGAESLKYHLFKISRRCKHENSEQRPTASEVLNEYHNQYKVFKEK